MNLTEEIQLIAELDGLVLHPKDESHSTVEVKLRCAFTPKLAALLGPEVRQLVYGGGDEIRAGFTRIALDVEKLVNVRLVIQEDKASLDVSAEYLSKWAVKQVHGAVYLCCTALCVGVNDIRQWAEFLAVWENATFDLTWKPIQMSLGVEAEAGTTDAPAQIHRVQ